MNSLMKLIVVILAFHCALALDASLHKHWQAWKAAHKKQYSDAEEHQRRANWEHHVGTIQKHNLEADIGAHTYWLGLNAYSDMSNAEFKRIMNGAKRPQRQQQRRSHRHMFKFNLRDDVPDSIDWRTQGYVTPVKDQGQCGSCWAFSATGALEGQNFASTGQLVSLSEQNLVDCSWDQGNLGCGGGLMDQAFQYIQNNGGIDTEDSYPYEAINTTCRFSADNIGATVTGYVDVTSGDENALQQAVGTIGPISVIIDASNPSFQNYKNGVYNEPACSLNNLDHAVLVVGYGSDSDSGSDYWIVKNSWGTTYGEQGYIRMSRNNNNQCGIASYASYPTV